MMLNEKRNLSMMMDLYALTMANGYFVAGQADKWAVFDLYYRRNPDQGGFAIFAGLEQVIEYVENLHFDSDDISYFRSTSLFNEAFLEFLKSFRFKGDIYAFQEGTIMYPGEPVLTVIAPLIDAQLIETAVLAQINHQSLIATKARRIVNAAGGRPVFDFGARRAHNVDAALFGARAAYIGGASGTSNVMAARQFGLPVSGTMAHSWVMFHGDDYQAFRQYAEIYPDEAVFLVDTYDVLRSGIPAAIRVAQEVLEPAGKRLKGIRLDSGDLAYLSKQSRVLLDMAGMEDCKIFASNSLDEYTILSLIAQGGRFDGFGVGERLITSKSDPVFGAVYKLVAVEEQGEFVPRIKISEAPEKITNPGLKKVCRIYCEKGHAVADLISEVGEIVDVNEVYRFVDPENPWKICHFKGCTAKELHHPVIKNGRRVKSACRLDDIRDYVELQLTNEIWPEEQRFDNPHVHYVDMSPDYSAMKMQLLLSAQKKPSEEDGLHTRDIKAYRTV
ncbi:TPA: nicotinate phosphoribosyltransferase [Raoultella ornithinolytica]|uniref:nicotinate phosphoribosyltransferase n=1 Tax=Enterobacteriaceae TaxID=543 RepID=UPI00197E1B30|nr:MULTISPECIES: nicotinate phosphoribosyltransferase [Enterobacteriaceae]MBN4035416.1 nicotinate phosphoribosyltransferase [Citrobacter freundii]MBZ7625647.1 nicotinate phosphoribosyltransferase [Klebsiella michiganensis]MCW9599802.1 nicotinate phosphoribosyltransferase [Klebsiella michiganensis]MCW9644414.1 nicotinate phosphoribosyltransferase [Klebsiella michiganensis]